MNNSFKSAANPIKLEVLNPRGRLPVIPVTGLTAPRFGDLSGKRIALLSDKPMAVTFFKAFEILLKQKYPSAVVLHFPSSDAPGMPDNTAEVAEHCDVWLQGIKTSGLSPTDSEARLEKLGKPGVAFTADSLLSQRKRQAAGNGVPSLRIVTIPSEALFACEGLPEKIQSIAESVFAEAIQALTAPLTETEKNPLPEIEIVDYAPLQFTGNSYTQAYENFQDYCNTHQMSDGLPLTPPTQEAVDWMLTGTRRSPDEEIGRMATRNGLATIEKIAINAVMAGARPEYLPVIIAAVECLTHPNFNQYHLINSGASPTALIWINGPIAQEIGMNTGLGYLGPGCRANAAIGRAVSLCMTNIGWRYVGGVAGVAGAPEGYCNFIFPENEKDSPWESFAVERGYRPQDSTVTVNECFICNRFGPGGLMNPQTTQKWLTDLTEIISNVKMGSGNTRYCQIVLYPSFARQIAAAGFTKNSLRQRLCENSRVPWSGLNAEQQAATKAAASLGNVPGLKPEDCQPGHTVPALINPKHLAILVAGDMAGYTVIFHSVVGSTTPTADNPDAPKDIDFMTRLIRGAALTKAGR